MKIWSNLTRTDRGHSRKHGLSFVDRQALYLGVRNFCFKASSCRHTAPHQRYSDNFTSAEQEDIFCSIVSVAGIYPTQQQGHIQIPSFQDCAEQHAESRKWKPSMSLLPRYDWRQRAPSRRSRRAKKSEEKVHVHRRKPELLELSRADPLYTRIEAYNDHFLPLLEAERLEDEAVLKERLSMWSLEKLQEDGYCLTELSAYWMQQNQFGRPTATFLIAPGITLPPHRFEKGTQVLVSRINPLIEKPYCGSVVSLTASQVRICFHDRFDLHQVTWRLDVGRPNLVFERMKTAISYLNHDAKALEEMPQTANRQYIIQGTHLRDVLLKRFGAEPPAKVEEDGLDEVGGNKHDVVESANGSSKGAFYDDMRIQSWAKRYSLARPMVMDGDMPLNGMNPSQIRAMATMIGNRISLVQGPPGTGKTKTIIETVKLLKVHFEVPYPILVCTYTNVAVDNLVEGLAAAGVKPLRVGFGGSIRASLLEHSLECKLREHPLQSPLAELVKEEETLGNKTNDLHAKLRDIEQKLKDAGTTRLHGRARNMQAGLISLSKQHTVVKSKIYAMQQKMLMEVIGEADVICTTCITSACSALNVIDFPVVFLDEASMSTEPASLIPLMKGSKHVALIGDHKQLPPVIVSKEAQSLGLGISLFERLTQEGVVPSVMLDLQYRMHPAISRFPSSEFYLDTLRDGTVDAAGNISPVLSPPESQYLQSSEDEEGKSRRPSVIFLDHAGNESVKDRSRVNHNEANIVASVVVDLLVNNPQLRGHDIGIIAPYVAQISLLMRIFNTDAKYQERFKEVLGDHRAMQLANIEIKTVDGFEGREKEVIIFSTVRNNVAGHIGFLADKRRLNVGLTRAKRGLFVIGSISTLKNGKMSGGEEKGVIRVGKGAESWQRYAKFLTEKGLVVSISGEMLQRALYGQPGVLPRTAGIELKDSYVNFS